MINHFRTLLLNQNSSSTPGANYPGEEYVPSNYPKKTLLGSLFTVYGLIFGVNPDRAMLNHRLRELTDIVHTNELEEFVLDFDPRVTYWPPSNNSIFNTIIKPPVITNVSGTKALYLNVSNPIVAGDVIYYSYLLDVTDGSHITIQSVAPAAPLVTLSYTITSGLSNLLQLPGSNISFQFQSGVGSQWTAAWLAQPNRKLGEVYADLIAGLTTDIANDLFDTNLTNMQTFKNIWEQSPYPPYRIGAVVLALATQINTLVN